MEYFVFLDYFSNVFTWYHLALLLGGTFAGIILGALPGLSPTMSVALLIPFTFHMEPASGLILLGAMYTATVAGGAISAILVNVPGAPANIATAMDGHKMAKQGKAKEALHYCFMSSFVGGIFGVIILIFFTPPLAEWSLKFGTTELFWIAILGITIIATIDSNSVVKGLLSGLFGLMLATVGDNPVLGVDRFVVTDHLTGGVNIVVGLIGLFAMPQVFNLMENYYKDKSEALSATGSSTLFQSFSYVFSRIKALSVGSLIGSLVGIIPGAGGQIAGLVAYDQTKKISDVQENYGKGEPEGIVAAESANNAMVGPSLIPLLTLSIPGSPTAAVLLGGLLIHGIFPGHEIFVAEQTKEVVWTFIDSLIVAQVFMLIIGLFLSRHSGWIMKVPDNYMAVSIFVLAVFGTYSIGNSYSDVLIMTALGTIMFFASKAGFSAVPVVLGIILGPIAENNFLLGKLIGGARYQGDWWLYFVRDGLNITLISICILSILYGVYSTRKSKKNT
jgi:putative tricarboxylic transport membrane protein